MTLALFAALDGFVHEHDLVRFRLGRVVCDWYDRWLAPDDDCGCR